MNLHDAIRQCATSPARSIGASMQIGGCIALALNVPQSGFAFPVMLAGSLLWLRSAYRAGDAPLFALNAVYCATNVLGIFRWLT